MDRTLVYAGQIPLDGDLLHTNRAVMIGLAKLAQAVLGSNTTVAGLACTPTAPASLQVQVAPGEIYAMANLDDSAYGSLNADTVHQILKQGILLDPVRLTCTPPVGVGQSVAYLVQASYRDEDAQPTLLPYYNAANPAQAFSGPNNSGAAQPTVRRGALLLQLKPGAAAATGTQQPPAADPGYVGLWVITVANGQVQITTANIARAPGAPFIPGTLTAFAPVASPTFTGTPTVPTPPALVTDTRIVNTEAMVRAGIRAGSFITVVGASVLTQNNLGGTVYLGGAGNYTVTLPLASQSPPGTQVHFISGTGTAPVTIARQGADAIFMNASGTQTQVLLALGDTLILESNGAAWYSAGGSASLAYTGGFSSLVAGTGYSQLPSGVLIQWGSAVSNAVAGERIPVTFPIAMADIAYSVVPVPSVSTTTPVDAWTDAISATAFGLRCSTASTGVRWIAIGRR